MPATPWIAGALGVAVIGGAVAGMSLDTTPIERFSDPLETIPRHKMAALDRKPQAHLPQHYEMKTPEGTLSVAEVVTRRSRLNPPQWPPASYAHGPQPYATGDDRLWEGADEYRQATQPQPATVPHGLADAQALEPATQDAPVAAWSGPKVVDVSAHLAAHN